EANETLEQRVTERSQAAEAAQQSKTRFLAAISHDVLQPLNAARLFASALRDSLPETDEQRHLAERVDASLRAAEELLDGLLDVSRLDAGGLRPTITDFDASVLVRELAAQYTPVAAGRGLRLHVFARSAWVRSDRRLLRRVLQNFMANALRYTRNGRIVLALRVRGEQVELQVWDTGPGIPEHHMQQIFNEFHRYQQPFDWGEQGLGLGLSICQRISRLLDHGLNARSQPGRGSMFSITLPRVPTPAQPPPLQRQPTAFGGDDSLAGMRVLCVDNEPVILDALNALLTRWGARPTLVASVEAAKTAQGPFDAAVVDLHLGDGPEGFAVIDWLRPQGVRRIALVTADTRDGLNEQATAAGAVLLPKPIKPAALKAFLSS
ncbi:hybrid sensor histidine kinase/response regulator, partial [Brevundimonas sp. UBA7838]|uniref:hybrid sensor histidine kinase/response regulator n=1 Tax=Brevundimonas sp. UBA7838 TaxID=1946142 RepID=UPI0025B7E844